MLPVFAIALVTLLGAAGFAFDSGRSYLAHAQLRQAVDAGALAGARTLAQDRKGFEAQAKKFFFANLQDNYLGTDIPDPTIRLTGAGRQVEVVARATVPTTLMKVLGIDSLQIAARSVVSSDISGLELSLVLDNSGSMQGKKLADLKQATKSLLKGLFGDQDTAEDLEIAVVPFTARVNLEDQSRVMTLEVAAGAAADDGASLAASLPRRLCFDLRKGLQRNDDTPPAEGAFELYSGTYNPAADLRGYEDRICPKAPLLPLTASKRIVTEAIADMKAGGCTRFDVGAAWGWRTISPLWQGVWEGIDAALPTRYENPGKKKAVVIMTDGANTPESCADDDDSRVASEALFAETCQEMKDKNILVYTITFKVDDEATKQLFEDCASAGRAFDSPSGKALEDDFAKIAGDLTNLRLAE